MKVPVTIASEIEIASMLPCHLGAEPEPTKMVIILSAAVMNMGDMDPTYFPLSVRG